MAKEVVSASWLPASSSSSSVTRRQFAGRANGNVSINHQRRGLSDLHYIEEKAGDWGTFIGEEFRPPEHLSKTDGFLYTSELAEAYRNGTIGEDLSLWRQLQSKGVPATTTARTARKKRQKFDFTSFEEDSEEDYYYSYVNVDEDVNQKEKELSEEEASQKLKDASEAVKSFLMFSKTKEHTDRLMALVDRYERQTLGSRYRELAKDLSNSKKLCGALEAMMESWTRDTYDEMQVVLAPGLEKLATRTVERLEFERIMREGAQTEEWLKMHRKVADNVILEYKETMDKGAAGLISAVSKAKGVLQELAEEINEGKHRHAELVREHEAFEQEMFELTRRQKKLSDSLQEFEDRHKALEERCKMDCEKLKANGVGLKRLKQSLRKQYEDDLYRCKEIWARLETKIRKNILPNCQNMLLEQYKRKMRAKSFEERAQALRKATLEKEIEELKCDLLRREYALKTARIELDVSELRASAIEAKCLRLEVQLRIKELKQDGTLSKSHEVHHLWSSEGQKVPPAGALPLLAQELDFHRRWLTTRGQLCDLCASTLKVRAPSLVGTPLSLLFTARRMLQIREQKLKVLKAIREQTQRGMRSSAMFKSKVIEQRRRKSLSKDGSDSKEAALRIRELVGRPGSANGVEETRVLVDEAIHEVLIREFDDLVHHQVDEEDQSLEAPDNLPKSLGELTQTLADTSSAMKALQEAWSTIQVPGYLEDLVLAFNKTVADLAEVVEVNKWSARWFEEEISRHAGVFGELLSGELAWLPRLAARASDRCTALQAALKLIEEASEHDNPESLPKAARVVSRMLDSFEPLATSETIDFAEAWMLRLQQSLRSRLQLQNSVSVAYNFYSDKTSVQTSDETKVESIGPNLQALIRGLKTVSFTLSAPRLMEKNFRSKLTFAELLSVMRLSADRVLQSDPEALRSAILGLADLDKTATASKDGKNLEQEILDGREQALEERLQDDSKSSQAADDDDSLPRIVKEGSSSKEHSFETEEENTSSERVAKPANHQHSDVDRRQKYKEPSLDTSQSIQASRHKQHAQVPVDVQNDAASIDSLGSYDEELESKHRTEDGTTALKAHHDVAPRHPEPEIRPSTVEGLTSKLASTASSRIQSDSRPANVEQQEELGTLTREQSQGSNEAENHSSHSREATPLSKVSAPLQNESFAELLQAQVSPLQKGSTPSRRTNTAVDVEDDAWDANKAFDDDVIVGEKDNVLEQNVSMHDVPQDAVSEKPKESRHEVVQDSPIEEPQDSSTRSPFREPTAEEDPLQQKSHDQQLQQGSHQKDEHFADKVQQFSLQQLIVGAVETALQRSDNVPLHQAYFTDGREGHGRDNHQASDESHVKGDHPTFDNSDIRDDHATFDLGRVADERKLVPASQAIDPKASPIGNKQQGGVAEKSQADFSQSVGANKNKAGNQIRAYQSLRRGTVLTSLPSSGFQGPTADDLASICLSGSQAKSDSKNVVRGSTSANEPGGPGTHTSDMQQHSSRLNGRSHAETTEADEHVHTAAATRASILEPAKLIGWHRSEAQPREKVQASARKLVTSEHEQVTGTDHLDSDRRREYLVQRTVSTDSFETPPMQDKRRTSTESFEASTANVGNSKASFEGITAKRLINDHLQAGKAREEELPARRTSKYDSSLDKPITDDILLEAPQWVNAWLLGSEEGKPLEKSPSPEEEEAAMAKSLLRFSMRVEVPRPYEERGKQHLPTEQMLDGPSARNSTEDEVDEDTDQYQDEDGQWRLRRRRRKVKKKRFIGKMLERRIPTSKRILIRAKSRSVRTESDAESENEPAEPCKKRFLSDRSEVLSNEVLQKTQGLPGAMSATKSRNVMSGLEDCRSREFQDPKRRDRQRSLRNARSNEAAVDEGSFDEASPQIPQRMPLPRIVDVRRTGPGDVTAARLAQENMKVTLAAAVVQAAREKERPEVPRRTVEHLMSTTARHTNGSKEAPQASKETLRLPIPMRKIYCEETTVVLPNGSVLGSTGGWTQSLGQEVKTHFPLSPGSVLQTWPKASAIEQFAQTAGSSPQSGSWPSVFSATSSISPPKLRQPQTARHSQQSRRMYETTGFLGSAFAGATPRRYG